MPDFLDRFGDQLNAAQASIAVPGPGRWPIKRRRLRGGWRLGVAIVAVLIAGGSAAAIIKPWDPTIGRPPIDGKVSTSAAPVAGPALTAYAVLRRPQTGRDRLVATHKLTRIGSEVHGVQLEEIRALGHGWILVPATSISLGPGRGLRPDVLCVTNGGVTGCGSADRSPIGAGLTLASSTSTTMVGLVPDGVARVRFTPNHGPSVETPVSSNFYRLVIHSSVRSSRRLKAPEPSGGRAIAAPPGYTGPTIPPPPRPLPGRLQWLDAAGDVTGPPTAPSG